MVDSTTGRGEGESTAPTFIARDQRPAFGLEVGRDDVTEAVGQDMVCFVVDVLPAVGAGLEDREEFRAGKSAPGGRQADPNSARWFCGRREEQRGRKPSSLPTSHPFEPGTILGISKVHDGHQQTEQEQALRGDG